MILREASSGTTQQYYCRFFHRVIQWCATLIKQPSNLKTMYISDTRGRSLVGLGSSQYRHSHHCYRPNQVNYLF